MKLKLHKIAAILLLSILIINCEQKPEKIAQFQVLKKDITNLDFENIPIQTPEFNVFNYMYFFNGGGLSVGDFNQDGLQDLFFTSNMQSNKLFLNEGNFRFKDVTDIAKLKGQAGWATGTTVVDINNDGLLDIYVSQMGKYETITGTNQLYVCKELKNGIPVFEDQAAQYGLDLVGFATQAVFFDYDLDGDLDMFQLNHSLHHNGTFGKRKKFDERHPLSGDKLLRNDGGKFVDVTSISGIYSTVIGYGLGIATGDMNLDGWPDLYISNDFHENDYLYINQQNGTFKEVLTEQMQHTSRFSMGVDMADINNDGKSEILSLDMAPYDPFILKSSLGEDAFNIFRFKLGYGYNHQFARNNLQLNNGNGTFSEIGMYAGVDATDWSWAPLFLDFDHDGYKDIFISNGIPRRMNDIDYINFRKGDDNMRWKTNANYLEEDDLTWVDKMPKIKLPNKFFRNTQHLKFEELGEQIKNNSPTFSNGAVYADLDNDGDLDIIVNNIEDAPYVYKNLTMEHEIGENNYFAFDFKGTSNNINGIGTKVIIYKGEKQLVYEHYPVRGYQSSVQLGLHIGLGDTLDIDSTLIIWPDQSYEKLANIRYNTKQQIEWKRDLAAFDFQSLHKKVKNLYNFVDVTKDLNIDFKHKENPFVEFNRETLIPHMVSTEGPALATGDVNGDGLEDIFIGSSKRRKSSLCLQNKEGQFDDATPISILHDSIFEDVAAKMIDIDNDQDLDIIVAAGGNEYQGQNAPMQQRYYLNTGNGSFERKNFEGVFMTASCVLPADFDKDGLIDFFFGARALPWNYGKTPKSYLLKNKGNGQFEEITDQYAGDLQEIGMVKEGTWVDINKDGYLDLILAIEWGRIEIFLNKKDRFERQALSTDKGWWNYVLANDFDEDGDIDVLTLNLGENSKFKPNLQEPIRLYVNDFDDNGQIEQILTYYLDNKEIPFANYAELTKQLVSLKKKYLYSKDLAKASLSDIFGKEKLANADVLEVNELRSLYFENMSETTLQFKKHILPTELQFSHLETALVDDFNQDGQKEALIAGNFYECNIEMGRYDANFGNILSITKNGNMEASSLGNLSLKGQIRRIVPIIINKEKHYILSKNNDFLQVIKIEKGD